MKVGLDRRALRWIRVRTSIVAILLFGGFGVVAARAVQLQVLQREKLGRMARDQYVREIELKPQRGAITDRNGVALAENAQADSIFIDPQELNNKGSAEVAVRRLAKALPDVDGRALLKKLERGGRFIWLKRRVSPMDAESVRALAIPGVGFAKEPRRYYPQRELAGHVVGFVGADGIGLAGIERTYDDALKGESMRIPSLRDARGMHLFGEAPATQRTLQGSRVELTLDRTLQFAAERALQRAVQGARAAAGTLVAMDPRTGEILALANEPPFNPNASTRKTDDMRNRAVVDSFEPGSTFKVFSIAAALEERVIKPNEPLFCENGAYAIGSHVVNDHKGYGWLGPAKILAVSSNIGTLKIAEKLGRERLVRYYRTFGFGDRTGIGWNGEPKGVVTFPRADVSLANMSFGQGVTATPLQITAGIAAIANGGMLMKPWLVKRVSEQTDDGPNVAMEAAPTPVRRAVSRETAATIARWMEQVVADADGTGHKARVDGYRVAGKTGTAQKVDPVSGGYSADKRFSSFVGFLPAEEPRIVIGVFIDEPKGEVYGGEVAAPAFRELAEHAMKALGVPPRDGAPKPAAGKEIAKRRSSEGVNLASLRLEGFLPAEGTAGSRAELEKAKPPILEVRAPTRAGGVAVPMLTGLPARAALRALEAADLHGELSGSGRVAGQVPNPGEVVEKGTKVRVTLGSSG